jgi:hypothetical protein
LRPFLQLIEINYEWKTIKTVSVCAILKNLSMFDITVWVWPEPQGITAAVPLKRCDSSSAFKSIPILFFSLRQVIQSSSDFISQSKPNLAFQSKPSLISQSKVNLVISKQISLLLHCQKRFTNFVEYSIQLWTLGACLI